MRHIQFYRNSAVFANYDAAKEAISAQAFLANCKDGEEVFARYTDNGQTVTMLGLVHVVGGQTGITIADATNLQSQIDALESGSTSDITNLQKTIGVNDGDTAITNYVSGDVYLSGATTVISALQKLNNVLVPSTRTDADVTGTTAGDNSHKNIITIHEGQLEAFADLHYNATTNKLTFVNSHGANEIQLTGVNLITDASYDSTTESLVIKYKKAGEATETSITIPLSTLITEFDFQKGKEGNVEYEASATKHNVALFADRSGDVSGSTKVYANIDIFDCGEY